MGFIERLPANLSAQYEHTIIVTKGVPIVAIELLREQPGFRPAPYLASRGMKWIQQYENSASTDEELKYYLKESHRIVSLGLTKKMQREFGLNQA